jgi:hypothetical protein
MFSDSVDEKLDKMLVVLERIAIALEALERKEIDITGDVDVTNHY